MQRFLSHLAVALVTFAIGLTAAAFSSGTAQTTHRSCHWNAHTRTRGHCNFRIAPFVPPASLEAKPDHAFRSR